MTGTSAAQASNPAGTVTGSQIAAQAQTYIGHKYLYGGYESNPGGWDCSSFVSWVLCHDMRLPIPGYGAGDYDGTSHGPVTQTYLAWSGATTESFGASGAQPGDLCCWETHIGIATGGGQYVSAYDSAEGTVQKEIASGGPTGEVLVVRRIKNTIAGSSSTAAATTSTGILGSLLGLPQLFGGSSSLSDLVERGGLIIFGALLLVVGLILMFPKAAGTVGGAALGGAAGAEIGHTIGNERHEKATAKKYNKAHVTSKKAEDYDAPESEFEKNDEPGF